MPIAESIAPALIATGLLCLFLPWANRENAWVRAALVTVSLIMTWNYLLWRITQTLPQTGSAWDLSFGIGFLGAELLTGIGGSITWILLMRSSSRSAQGRNRQRRPVAISAGAIDSEKDMALTTAGRRTSPLEATAKSRRGRPRE